MTGNTYATQLTGAGRSAIATVAVRGPDAEQVVLTRFRPVRSSVTRFDLNRIYFGTWHWRDYAEELVVCRTTESVVEVHCHGGTAAASCILNSLQAVGTQIVSTTEWLERLEPDRFVREAMTLLPRITTEKSARIVLEQIQYAMRRALRQILESLGDADVHRAHARTRQILSWAALGVRLDQPFRVVLLGPPNAGKSSLVNALVGYERAIVYDQPGTTRDTVAVPTAIDGWPLSLTDTAGVRETSDRVEQAGIQLATQALQRADLVLVILDMSRSPATLTQEEAFAQERIPPSIPRLRVGTKCEMSVIESSRVDVVTSVHQGIGIETLGRQVVRILVPQEPEPGTAIPLTAWQHQQIACLDAHLSQGQVASARQLLGKLVAE